MSQVIKSEDRVVKERLANGSPIPFKPDSKAFMKRLQLETWVSLRRFFSDKKFHAGGSIPLAHLFTQQNLAWSVRPFVQSVDLCYDLFQRSKIAPPVGFDHAEVDWEIYYVNNLLSEVQHCHIPPYLQGGIMVLYFKICHGQKLPEIALDITHLVT